MRTPLRLLFNDLVVREDFCHFSCEYCLSYENVMKLPKDVVQIASPGPKREPLLYREGSALKARLDEAVARFQAHVNACILRVSGGEILQIRGIMDFIREQAKCHETVQLLTNGYFLTDEVVASLVEMGNIHVHFSLDGHTLDMNGYRTRVPAIHDRLIKNLARVIAAGLPLEVGSVLTNRNTANWNTFLEYLLQFEGQVTAFPFPVRGEVARKMGPTTSDVASFVSTTVGRYDKYAGVLVPKPYINELATMLTNGRRTLRCHVPAVMIQSFDDGVLTPCPNCWATEMGNVIKEPPEEVFDRFGKGSMYTVFLWPKPRLEFCRGCWTAFDVINLYINDRMSEQELLRLPLYRRPETLKRLREAREERRLVMASERGHGLVGR